jgi:hypothetical protein
LQIWILVGKGNVNPYTGEARALVENQGIRYYQLRQNLSNAKNSVMEQFNMTDTTIENISITSDSNTANQWFSDLRQWLRFNLGI